VKELEVGWGGIGSDREDVGIRRGEEENPFGLDTDAAAAADDDDEDE